VTHVLRYFDVAAPLHHADEDIDLFPRLRAIAVAAGDSTLLAALDEAARAHGPLESRWTGLRAHLVSVAAGAPPDPDRIAAFVAHEEAHLAIESGHILPAARRLLDADALHALGRAMAARRGLDARPGRMFQYPRA
jgi:hypothetical protein